MRAHGYFCPGAAGYESGLAGAARLRAATTLFSAATLLFSASPASVPRAEPVDFTTLHGKVLFGYQGWFNCPMAGSGSWTHWSRGVPTAANLTVDMYPDLREFKAADLCRAGAMTVGGAPAYLYASRSPVIVDAHFRWMEEHGLDGVLVQRFINEASGKRSSGDVVLRNIMAAAAAHGRTFAIEYDLSGGSESRLADLVQADWKYMVDVLKATSHPNYLHHDGKPVVGVWGPGLDDHTPVNPAVAAGIIDWFRTSGPGPYRALYMGGTPSSWRTLNAGGDARTDPAWKAVYASMDVVQPWSVGRYSDTVAVNNRRRTLLIPDIAETRVAGRLYMPVVFPGFSWYNLKQGRQNAIPRLGGRFLWRQAYNAKLAGATMLKIAMFDEVDESTAMFKLASKRSQAPDQGYWLALDADRYDLPSDWYLRLAGEITRLFHGTLPMNPDMPIDPSNPGVVGLADGKPGARSGAVKTRRFGGRIRFEAPASSGEIGIFSLGGALHRCLAMKGGFAYWDARDASGKPSPPGIYLVRPMGTGTGAAPVGGRLLLD